MYSIYKRTNILTGKCYIGLTKQTEPQRWKQHIAEVKRYPNSKLSNALKKYGFADDIWKSEILEMNIETKDKAGLREIYWIWKFNSHENGYNSTSGGNIPPERRLKKPVIVLNYNTGEYCEFDSLKQASAVIGCHIGGFMKALSKQRATIYNFYVFRKEDFNADKIEDYLKLPRTKNPKINNRTLEGVCLKR